MGDILSLLKGLLLIILFISLGLFVFGLFDSSMTVGELRRTLHFPLALLGIEDEVKVLHAGGALLIMSLFVLWLVLKVEELSSGQ